MTAALAVAVPLATAAASSASAFDLSNTGAAGVPQVATAADGTTTAVWYVTTDTTQLVQARRIAPDGTLGAVLDVSSSDDLSSAPRVAVGTDGAGILVWQRHDADGYHATMRRIAADGTLAPASVDLSPSGANAYNPDVAISANGSAVATWTRFDSPDACCSIVQARRIASNGSLGSVLDLSASGQNADAQRVAVADDGSATVAWRRQDNSLIYIAQAAHISPSDSVSSLGDLSDTGQGAQTPVVAMQGDGVAEILWQRFADNNLRIQARHVAADQTVGSLTNVSADGGDASNPEIVTNPQGGFRATWQRLSGEDSIVQSTDIDSSGSQGSVLDLSSASVKGGDPGVAFAPSGDALVTWQTGSTTPRIQSRTIPHSGSPGPVQNLTGAGSSNTPAVALDAGGNSTVVWVQSSDGSSAPIARGTRIASGTTIAPVADVTPSSKSFGFVQPGQASDWQTVTVANTGTGAMSIGDVVLDGDNPDAFETQNDTCSNTWVLEGASCTVDARFAPQDTGDPSVDLGDKAAALTVTDDASGNPHSVALTGTAGTQPAPTPTPTPTPTTPTEPQNTPGPTVSTPESPPGEQPLVPPTVPPTRTTLVARADTPRRGGFVVIRVVTDGPGRVSVVGTMRPAVHVGAHKRAVYGRARATARHAGALRLLLRPGARGRALLDRRRRMRILLTITFRPQQGPTVVRHRSLDVRAPHRHKR